MPFVKNFDGWNVLKKGVHCSENLPFFRERDIFFAHLGENIGCEENGKGDEFLRPVLVLKKISRYSAFIVPLSSQKKEGIFYFSFTSSLGIQGIALLSQVKVIDSKRLKVKKGMMNESDFSHIKKELGKFLGLLSE